jgi:hypothetical protein
MRIFNSLLRLMASAFLDHAARSGAAIGAA